MFNYRSKVILSTSNTIPPGGIRQAFYFPACAITFSYRIKSGCMFAIVDIFKWTAHNRCELKALSIFYYSNFAPVDWRNPKA
jgi:hypothetical protein